MIGSDWMDMWVPHKGFMQPKCWLCYEVHYLYGSSVYYTASCIPGLGKETSMFTCFAPITLT